MNITRRERGHDRYDLDIIRAATAEWQADTDRRRAQCEPQRETRTTLVQPRLRDTKP